MKEHDNVVPQKLFSSTTGLPSLTSASAIYAIAAMSDGFYQFNSTGGSTGLAGGGAFATGTYYATSNTTQSSSGTIPLSSLIFAGAGAVSVGVSDGSVVISANAAAESNWFNLLGANTAGNTTASGSIIGLSGVGVTLSGTNGSVIVVSAGPGAADGANFIAAGTRTATSLGTVLFSDANGLTWGLNAVNGSIVTGSVREDWLSTQSNQAVSNSAGSFTFQTLNFSNANNVTWGTSAGGIVTASVAAGAADGANFIAAGTRTATSLGTVLFDNANGATFGMNAVNGSVVTMSYTVPAAFAAGVTNLGDTAGNTGTGSSGTMYFRGSNSLTLSQSTAAGATTIVFQPFLMALSGGAGISLSTNGGTIVILTV